MKKSQDRRFWILGGAVAAVLIVVVGWFMFIGPELASTRSLHDQAATTRQQNTLLQQKVKSLRLKSSKLAVYTSALKSALSALPSDSGLPAFTRQLAAQAKDRGVALNSVVVGEITAMAPAAPAPAAVPAAVPAPADGAATPTTTTTAPAVIPATTSAAGSLFSVAVTVQSDGTLVHQLAFLNDIRTAGSRRALITGCQLTVGTGAKKVSLDEAAAFTTQLTIFSAPQTPEQTVQLARLLSGNVGN
jgi:hypothetical protein